MNPATDSHLGEGEMRKSGTENTDTYKYLYVVFWFLHNPDVEY